MRKKQEEDGDKERAEFNHAAHERVTAARTAPPPDACPGCTAKRCVRCHTKVGKL